MYAQGPSHDADGKQRAFLPKGKKQKTALPLVAVKLFPQGYHDDICSVRGERELCQLTDPTVGVGFLAPLAPVCVPGKQTLHMYVQLGRLEQKQKHKRRN